MHLKEGMKVCLSKQGREKWLDAPANPHKSFGTVIRVYEDELYDAEVEWEEGNVDEDNYFPFVVNWDNGTNNSYRWGDLEEVRVIIDRPLEDYM